MPFATQSGVQPQSAILRALGTTNSGQGVGFTTPAPSAAPGGAPRLPAAPPGQARGAQGDLVELARAIDVFPGRNHVEKAIAYLRDQPGGNPHRA